MPFIQVPGVYRFTLYYTNSGQNAANVFHRRKGVVAWDSSNVYNSAFALKEWWRTYIMPNVPDTVTLERIMCISENSQTDPSLDFQDGLPLVGTRAATPLPQNVTVAVAWKTSGRGRSFQGRTYHVGLCLEDQLWGTLTDTAYTWLINAYTPLIGVWAVSPYFMCVVSRQHNGVILNPATYYQILSCTINRDLDSGRRRLPGR